MSTINNDSFYKQMSVHEETIKELFLENGKPKACDSLLKAKILKKDWDFVKALIFFGGQLSEKTADLIELMSTPADTLGFSQFLNKKTSLREGYQQYKNTLNKTVVTASTALKTSVQEQIPDENKAPVHNIPTASAQPTQKKTVSWGKDTLIEPSVSSD